MSSIIKVDQIQTAAGGDAGTGVFNAAGTVLQEIYGWCDGRTVSGVTLPNVTTFQSTTDAYADVTGSNVTYTPPSGATTVVYHFSFNFWGNVSGAITHFRFYIDGTEVQIARTTQAKNYQTSNLHEHDLIDFIVPIQVGGVDDVANAKVASWTTPKTMKVMCRAYNSGYLGNLHRNYWWDGVGASGATEIRKPTLSIKAIK